jgi:hypothetical protein
MTTLHEGIGVKITLNKNYSGKLNTHVWYNFSASLVVFDEITLEAGNEFWVSMKYPDYPYFCVNYSSIFSPSLALIIESILYLQK